MCSRKVPRKQVSIPLRYAKNCGETAIMTSAQGVSIPLRYAKNCGETAIMTSAQGVSIPLRYAKNGKVSPSSSLCRSFNSS